MKKVTAFFRDVRSEMQKVHWPSREETLRLTIIVIIATTLIGVYVGTIDYLLTKVLEQVIQ